MKASVRVMAVLIGVMGVAGAAFAQSPFDANFTYEDILNSKFTLRAGGWFQDVDGNLMIDETKGDTEVDFQNDLGLEDNDDFTIRLEVQPWEKHHIRLGYNGIHFDGDQVLSRNVTIDGKNYALNGQVVTDVEMDTYEIGYRYDLWRGENYVIAPQFQVNLVNFDVMVQGTDATTGLAQSSSEDQLVPLPMLGIRGEFFPHPRFGVFADMKGLTIGDTASAIDLEVGAQINLCKNFSLVGGYRYMYFDFDISDAKGDMTIDGPFVAGQIQF